MTAYRVVTDHAELDNVGQLTHDELDAYVIRSPWIVVSGSSGPFPASSRRLAAGAGVTIVDHGPGNDIVISSNSATTGSQISWMERPTGDRGGVNQSFGLAHVPLPSGSLMFFVNGQLLEQGSNSDYVVSGSTVVLQFMLRSGSGLWASYPF